MPGIVTIHVWERGTDGGAGLEHVLSRRMAIFDASPGTPWRGFYSFVTSLAREYACEAMYDYSKHQQAERSRAPAGQRKSLLDELPENSDSYTFPQGGELTLVVVRVRHAALRVRLSLLESACNSE